MAGVKNGAHALPRNLDATMTAAIAMGALLAYFARVPAQLPGGGRRILGWVCPQGPGCQARFRIHDLARIENALGIEDRLELAKDGVERTVLPGDPGRAGQARAVLGADGAPEIQGQRMHLLGDGQQTGHILLPLQVEKRAHVHLPGARMHEKGAGGFQFLQNVLDAMQILPERFTGTPTSSAKGTGCGPPFSPYKLGNAISRRLQRRSISSAS